VRLTPGRVVRVPVTGPVRALGVTLVEPAREGSRLEVTLRTSAGAVVASAARDLGDRDGPATGRPWYVPVAADGVPAGRSLVAEVAVRGASGLVVAARRGAPALSVVAGRDDGLRLVRAGSTVVYHRIRALDRARWASSAVVEPDPDRRLALLAGDGLRADQVVLDAPGAPAEGRPGRIDWVTDGLNEFVLDVTAEGAGYLVLADALQVGWKATVDSAPAQIVPADHGVVAVAVPTGSHRVRLSYPGPVQLVSLAVSGTTAAALLGAAVVPPLVSIARRRTRRRWVDN
jgi:hypothetical protein